MAWQGKAELQRVRLDASAMVAAQVEVSRSTRTFLADSTTGNLETMRKAVENLDNLLRRTN